MPKKCRRARKKFGRGEGRCPCVPSSCTSAGNYAAWGVQRSWAISSTKYWRYRCGLELNGKRVFAAVFGRFDIARSVPLKMGPLNAINAAASPKKRPDVVRRTRAGCYWSVSADKHRSQRERSFNLHVFIYQLPAADFWTLWKTRFQHDPQFVEASFRETFRKCQHTSTPADAGDFQIAVRLVYRMSRLVFEDLRGPINLVVSDPYEWS